MCYVLTELGLFMLKIEHNGLWSVTSLLRGWCSTKLGAYEIYDMHNLKLVPPNLLGSMNLLGLLLLLMLLLLVLKLLLSSIKQG